jgi:uncharacterized cupin superfamily protein
VPSGRGWFVLNARDSRWYHRDGRGSVVTFEGEGETEDEGGFADLGINVQVLGPGEPMAMYHAEEGQEGFLVVSGECVLIVEGEERPLKQWDFFHCPPWTAHTIVGAGDAPAVIVCVGARREGLRYPVDEAAQRHGASAERETTDAREAYARFERAKHGPPPPGF